jgi:Mg2+ and Co2+ transporter CorA
MARPWWSDEPGADELAVRYAFHELAIEDCRHRIQLAKVDYYEGYHFIIINSTLIRDESLLIHEDMRIYFRDVYDHAVRAMDFIETYRDLLTGGLDIYLTQMANRTNDVVKALTIVATIMLPLTVVTGYGMKFEYFPLLKDPNGIWYITGVLVLLALGMLAWFKRKKWLWPERVRSSSAFLRVLCGLRLHPR